MERGLKNALQKLTEAEGRPVEMDEDACQYLAARAAKVCRVVCGIPMALKGGET